MSAKHYFPDSFCRCPRRLPIRSPPRPPPQAPSVAAVVAQGVSTVRVVLEQEEGAVMQEGDPPSRSAVTTHRFAYNSALQNDL